MRNPVQTLLRCAFILALPLSGQTICAKEADWPRLQGDRRPECVEALTLARQAFDSKTFLIFDQQTVADRFSSKALLQPAAEGDQLVADPSAFDTLETTGPMARNLYWGKQLVNGYRLAVLVSGHGWREDAYYFYTLAPSATVESVQADDTTVSADPRIHTIASGTYIPPRIYRRASGQGTWALTFGESWQPLATWNVWVPATDTLRDACSIQFRPAVKRAIDLLPDPVRKLELLLDQTMGSGIDEGTLHPTGRLRIDVDLAWANIAMRPWAAASRSGVYNSRAQVDAGLARWAGQRPGNRKLLASIQRQYPLAQQALAQYYRERFGVATAIAQRAAAYVLDLAFRSHYTFSRQNGEQPHTPAEAEADAAANPWPSP